MRWLAAAFLLVCPVRAAVYNAGELNTSLAVKPPTMERQAFRSLTFYAPLEITTGLAAFGGGPTTPTFTRGGGVASYMSATGLVKVASGPRFPPAGYFSEVASTNIALRSEEFDNAYWTPNAISVSANADTAPDATATMDRMIESAGSSAKYFSRSITGTASSTNVLSIFAESSNRYVALGITGASNDLVHFFKLSDGTVGTASEIGGAYSSAATIEAVPGYPGVYRCSVVITTTADTPTAMFVMMSNADATRSYTGDGSSFVKVWGIQYESGAPFLSSYIPTTSATVTRDKDQLTYPSTENLPTAGKGGTLVVSVSLNQPGDGGANDIFCTRSSTGTNGTDIRRSAVPAKANFSVNTASAQANVSGTTTLAAGTIYKIGGAFATNDVELYVNGLSEGTDVNAAMPTHTEINVGQNGNDEKQINGTAKTAMIFKRRLKADEMQRLK